MNLWRYEPAFSPRLHAHLYNPDLSSDKAVDPSLIGVWLRAGLQSSAIVFHVERTRDGGRKHQPSGSGLQDKADS